MRPMPRLLLLPLFALAACLMYFTSFAQEKTSKSDFDMTASYIEACSCDMFCPCYFNTHSTSHMDMGEHHMDEHFCRANLVLKVDKGFYKDTKLDGAKVWIATDLGSDWSTGKDSWLVVNFDPSVGKEQQAALGDRKSTRLNSSHGYISYAVFCLKKKKTIAPHLLAIY